MVGSRLLPPASRLLVLARSLEELDQVGDRLVAGLLITVQAVLRVATQHLAVDTGKSRLHRRYLGHDLAAVAIFLDHALDAAHLTLDPA